MSRFAYLIDTWPDVYEILKDAEEKLYYDSNITLIKLRQAVEIIVKKILESEENFDQVELVELIDKLDTIDYLNRNFNNKLTNLFHEIRKYGNKAAHEGYKDDELAKYFLDELKDILFQIKKIIKGDNTDYEKNFINPFTFNCNVSIEEELRESKNWFERGVFETKEEFYQRIKNHEGIKIGKIYLEKVEPIITEKIAAFPFSIYKIDETIKFPEIKFIYMNKNDYNDLPKNSSDFEIYSKLDVVNEEVVIDIENTYIFVNKKKYKVNVLVLDSNWYESKDKFKETINRLDPIPIGIVKIKMNEYDIETEKLPIKIEEYYWMSNFFNQKKGYIKIDRNSAKILCKENIIFNLIGKLICWEDSIKVKRCYIESKEFNTSIIINLEKEDNILGYIEQAELGNKEAIYKIGELYFEGEGVEQDYTKAYEWYKKAAELGEAKAMYSIGLLYQNGKGVERDYTKAYEWYKKAAELGEATAMCIIGWLYFEGEGVERDYTKAYEWFKKAAELGETAAMYGIGGLYQNGKGVERDYTKAYEWYKKAAELGEAIAMCTIGLLYVEGKGVEQDYTKAYEWFKKAAELGEAKAMYSIGLLYQNGKGVERDYTKAYEWYKKAAELGEATAMCTIGLLYVEGEGVEQDYTKAYEWYKKAAELGEATAMYSIGLLYQNGKGVKQDYNKAYKWYKKAAELGEAKAMCTIGLLYVEGEGVEQDYTKAYKWYKKAAELGHAISINNIGWLYQNGKGVEQDYNKAYEWYKKAAELGEATAMYSIGLLYEEGKGVEQDYNKAYEWYKKAAELGEATAKNKLEGQQINNKKNQILDQEGESGCSTCLGYLIIFFILFIVISGC